MYSRDAEPQLELTIVEDGVRAILPILHTRTTVAEIQELLEREGICVGVSQHRIRLAVRTARRTKRPARDVVVAEGERPRAASRPHLAVHTPDGLDTPGPLGPILDLMGQEWDEIARQAPALRVWAVGRGDRLATIRHTGGAEGLDVRGAPIPIPEPPEQAPVDPELEPGPGVQVAPDDTDFMACTYGYAGIDNDGRLCVLEPIWIAPDMMLACLLHLPRYPGSSSPSAEDLRALLEGSGIVFGIDEEAIAALVAGPPQEPPPEPLICLARGEPARSAADVMPAFAREWELQAGAFRTDGSIDFHERNMFPPTRQDALLAECEAFTSGTPGHTVFGVETPPPGGRVDLELIAGDNVRLCTQGDVQRLYATSDGGVVLNSAVTRDIAGAIVSRQYHIAVQPVAHFPSDVDYETGNIDFDGSVVIDGSVRGGFQVRASGGIAVAGSIEAGATLTAGGDVTVGQGVVGRETRVTARGTVRARFVQEARVEAGADVTIGSYVHGAFVQAQGRVRVEGMGGSGDQGGIVGGQTWALGGITTRNAGSARSSSTKLYAGITAEDLDHCEQLHQGILETETAIQRLLAAIGLRALEADAVRELVGRHPDRKDNIVRHVKEARQLEQGLERRLRQQQELRARLGRTATAAPVDVSGRAFSQVSVQIGDQQLVLRQDLCQVRLYLDLERSAITCVPYLSKASTMYNAYP